MEVGKKTPNFFVLSTIRGHFSPDDKVKALIDQRLNYFSKDLLIETTQSQQIIKDMVEKEKVRQNLYANVVGMKPYKDKGVRLEEVIPYFEQGRVFLNPNMLRLRDELVMFPNGDHDDLVDALVMCLSHLKKRLKAMSYQSNIQTKTYPTLVPDPVTGRLR
jgi:predicted phage terminase large subunit-like protein